MYDRERRTHIPPQRLPGVRAPSLCAVYAAATSLISDRSQERETDHSMHSTNDVHPQWLIGERDAGDSSQHACHMTRSAEQMLRSTGTASSMMVRSDTFHHWTCRSRCKKQLKFALQTRLEENAGQRTRSRSVPASAAEVWTASVVRRWHNFVPAGAKPSFSTAEGSCPVPKCGFVAVLGPNAGLRMGRKGRR